jgi:hypothetical protein
VSVPIGKFRLVFSQPKRRIFKFVFTPYLYQTDHAESNAAIGECEMAWHLSLFRHFQAIFEVFGNSAGTETNGSLGIGYFWCIWVRKLSMGTWLVAKIPKSTYGKLFSHPPCGHLPDLVYTSGQSPFNLVYILGGWKGAPASPWRLPWLHILDRN